MLRTWNDIFLNLAVIFYYSTCALGFAAGLINVLCSLHISRMQNKLFTWCKHEGILFRVFVSAQKCLWPTRKNVNKPQSSWVWGLLSELPQTEQHSIDLIQVWKCCLLRPLPLDTDRSLREPHPLSPSSPAGPGIQTVMIHICTNKKMFDEAPSSNWERRSAPTKN